jgi:hypothetical protein
MEYGIKNRDKLNKRNFKAILRIYLCDFKGAGLILGKKKGVI